MWQHLFLQNLFGIFDSPFLSHTWFCSSGTNKVQSHILFLNYKSFIQRWLHLETQRQHWSHDSHMAGRSSGCSRATNESLAKTSTNTDHFHHLRVIKVIDDVFQDVSVRHKSQRSKYNDDWNFLSDVRQRRHNPLTDCTLFHSLEK